MKRVNVLIIISIILISLISSTLVYAKTVSPDEAQEISSAYLRQEWGRFISDKPYIGAVYNFLKTNSQIFEIFIGMPFDLSFAFILALALWIIAFIQIYKALKLVEILNKVQTLIVSILITVIVAQLALFKLISLSVSSLVFAPSNWWMRFFLILVTIVVIVLVKKIPSIMMNIINEKKKEAAQAAEEAARKRRAEREDRRRDYIKKIVREEGTK
jgi:Sec-independent protein translocase protein TatA